MARGKVIGSEQRENNQTMDVTLAALGQSKRLELLKILIETETGYGVTYLSSVLSVKPPTVE